jgi:hypothetical protein
MLEKNAFEHEAFEITRLSVRADARKQQLGLDLVAASYHCALMLGGRMAFGPAGNVHKQAEYICRSIGFITEGESVVIPKFKDEVSLIYISQKCHPYIDGMKRRLNQFRDLTISDAAQSTLGAHNFHRIPLKKVS